MNAPSNRATVTARVWVTSARPAHDALALASVTNTYHCGPVLRAFRIDHAYRPMHADKLCI
jgi:hypothetical protein